MLTLVDAPAVSAPPANGTPTPPTPSADTPQARKAAMVARLQAIANRLNSDGVPTLSGKGRWQKGTIGHLLGEVEGER